MPFCQKLPGRYIQTNFVWFISFFIFFFSFSLTFSQDTPQPPTQVQAFDTPSDAGKSITVQWGKSSDDGEGLNNVILYEVLRSTSPEGEYTKVGDSPRGTTEYVDNSAKDKIPYYYKIRALSKTSFSDSPLSPAVISSPQWFKKERFNALIVVLVLSLGIIYFIQKASKGKEMFVRKIAAIEAVDEAVGRATEMGKKVYFIPGIYDMDSMQTVAAVTILGHVAKRVAEYEAKLEVPNCYSLVMVACRETVKQAYLNAGKPDNYSDDMIYYLTQDQFGYTAAVSGLFVREKPAAIFLQGHFFAESLVLAETGNSVGAIQIAGTDQPTQLPFFVAACDYTLIGEELFAASAYLSKNPKLLGSLKGQDLGKLLMMIAIILGSILESLGILHLAKWFTYQ